MGPLLDWAQDMLAVAVGAEKLQVPKSMEAPFMRCIGEEGIIDSRKIPTYLCVHSARRSEPNLGGRPSMSLRLAGMGRKNMLPSTPITAEEEDLSPPRRRKNLVELVGELGEGGAEGGGGGKSNHADGGGKGEEDVLEGKREVLLRSGGTWKI